MTIEFDGRPVPAEPSQSVGAALWSAGIRSWRTTRIGGAPRGIFCGIGACFDCLAIIDGKPGQRACLAAARPGTVVSSGLGGAPGSARPATPPARSKASAAASEARARSEAPNRSGALAAARHDVAVVGAGPAGLAAAATAALAGCRVVLLDSAPSPGGQFWRHREGEAGNHGYRDWSVFSGLRSIVEERVDYIAGATVWFAGAERAPTSQPGFALHTAAGRFEAERLVLATGAYDRALPFPGWDLPGVVTPGAAQALLKGSGVALGREVVVAGAGPFLLPVAVALADAGIRVVGVYEAGDPGGYLSRPGTLATAAAKLGEAAGYAAALARHRVPYRVRRIVVAAHGTGSVSGVDIARLDRHGQLVPGSIERVRCDAVAVGYGFTANLELALSLGCSTRVGADGGLAVMVNADGQTSVPGLFAAGEVTGVGGALLAVAEGELAGAAAARVVATEPALSRRELAALRRRGARLREFAEAMHGAHTVPAGWTAWLEETTIVCRCEDVTYGRIVQAVTDLGASDARTVKLLARPGMGWCQGRVCGFATANVTAMLCGRAVRPADLAAFAHRPLAAPVPLGDLAQG